MQETQKYLCDCGRLPNVSCMGVPRGQRNTIECFAEATLCTPMQDPSVIENPPPTGEHSPARANSRPAVALATNTGTGQPVRPSGNSVSVTTDKVTPIDWPRSKVADYTGVKVPVHQLSLKDFDTDSEVI